MNKRAGAQPPVAPANPKRLSYETVRDDFLREAPQTDEEALDYFVHLGMYIHDRWLAISADTPEGQPLDEENSNRWDDCTDHELQEIREKSQNLIDREVGRRRISAFVASFLEEPFGTILKGISWALWRMWEHFWGALGLIAFGYILVLLFPHIVKDIRSQLDEAMPAQTRPADMSATSTSLNKQLTNKGNQTAK